MREISVADFENLFPPHTLQPSPCRNEWTLAHNRLFSLVDRTCDYSQPNVPEMVQTLAHAISHVTDWADDESAYIFYRDDDAVKEKSDAIAQRVDSPDYPSLCYLQAPVVLQRCLIVKYRQEGGPFQMIDIKKFVAKHLDSDQLERHFLMYCGSSLEILRSILPPGSSIEINSICGIEPDIIKKYGPALIMSFRVHSDFLDEGVLVHSGLPTGPFVGLHSMLLVGVKGTGESKAFMVQNWWRKKQFVQVSVSYMLDCMPLLYFVRTPQTEIAERYPVVYGGYAESGGVDAEDREICTLLDSWGDSEPEPSEE
jgi:hypothetical protein